MNIEMKDSGIAWIGEIPMHWESTKLKNVLALKTGTTPKAFEDINESDELINWYTPSDVTEDGNIVLSSERKLAKRVLDLEHISLYPAGSLIFVGIGALAGKVGYAIESGYSNQQITALIPKEGNSKYYYYFLLADKKRIRDNAFFTTLPIINNGYLGQVKVLLPSVEEQSLIANFLDKKCAEIDDLIALQEQMIAQLTTYKQAVITETVTKGLDPNVKMKDSGVEWIGEIPEHWEVCKLKNYCTDRREKATGNYKYIGLENVESYSGRYVETDSKYDTEQAIICRPNDVIFGKLRPYLAKTLVITELCCCSSEFVIFSQIPEANFLKYALLSDCFVKIVDSSTFGTKMPRADAGFIKNMVIAIPPLSEQQSIANYLDQKCKEIDELISVKKEKIEKLKAYKKSVINEYVTGKKQVN